MELLINFLRIEFWSIVLIIILIPFFVKWICSAIVLLIKMIILIKRFWKT